MDTTGAYELGDRLLSKDGVEIPAWIEQDLTYGQLAGIAEGGCDSGAYMPAVTYRQALETMSKLGDAVIDYLEDVDEIPALVAKWAERPCGSWALLATKLLSAAVDSWAFMTLEELETPEDEATA